MPYARPAEANNRPADRVADICARNGDGEWREVLTATDLHRSVLIRWKPGTTQTPHRHPGGEEIFVIHEGEIEFDFGNGRTERAGPGSIMYAPAGQWHALRIVGDRPALLMCFLSHNEPGDTVED